MQFIDFLGIYPSTKMAITPLLIDQIEQFQWPELSTAKDLSPGIFTSHVARVMCPQVIETNLVILDIGLPTSDAIL